MVWNTLHWRQIFIFFSQLTCFWPWQIVPLINQQRFPALNSHAGQFCFVSLGHVRITQQGLSFLWGDFLEANRKRTWRSIWTGIFLHPCSKLCMALRETPNNCAICLCVFPRYWRAVENSFCSTKSTPLSFFLSYHNVGKCKRYFSQPHSPIDTNMYKGLVIIYHFVVLTRKGGDCT